MRPTRKDEAGDEAGEKIIRPARRVCEKGLRERPARIDEVREKHPPNTERNQTKLQKLGEYWASINWASIPFIQHLRIRDIFGEYARRRVYPCGRETRPASTHAQLDRGGEVVGRDAED
jgi:hypothetical protein